MSSEDMSVLSRKVDLNIFSNCTKLNSSDDTVIKSMFKSWTSIFNISAINNVNIFIDPQPNESMYGQYSRSVKEYFLKEDIQCTVHKTNGLADGYIKSVNICETDYIFQIEHDWIFLDTIKHTLSEILECMIMENIEHLRFNKRKNVNAVNERLCEVEINGIKLCRTTKRSNNPHVIDRGSYMNKWNDYIDLSNTPKRADGIENKLVGQTGFIYGGILYPQQIKHTDATNERV